MCEDSCNKKGKNNNYNTKIKNQQPKNDNVNTNNYNRTVVKGVSNCVKTYLTKYSLLQKQNLFDN